MQSRTIRRAGGRFLSARGECGTAGAALQRAGAAAGGAGRGALRGWGWSQVRGAQLRVAGPPLYSSTAGITRALRFVGLRRTIPAGALKKVCTRARNSHASYRRQGPLSLQTGARSSNPAGIDWSSGASKATLQG